MSSRIICFWFTDGLYSPWDSRARYLAICAKGATSFDMAIVAYDAAWMGTEAALTMAGIRSHLMPPPGRLLRAIYFPRIIYIDFRAFFIIAYDIPHLGGTFLCWFQISCIFIASCFPAWLSFIMFDIRYWRLPRRHAPFSNSGRYYNICLISTSPILDCLIPLIWRLMIWRWWWCWPPFRRYTHIFSGLLYISFRRCISFSVSYRIFTLHLMPTIPHALVILIFASMRGYEHSPEHFAILAFASSP